MWNESVALAALSFHTWSRPRGRFHVLYAERGTKAIVVDGTEVVRELNRSFDHATEFDYPVAVGRRADGREILVHCPEQRNVLEVEDPGHR